MHELGKVLRKTAIGFFTRSLLLLLLDPSASMAQTVVERYEIIRGVVTSDKGAPLNAVGVIVTRSPDRKFKATETDRDGRFEMIWPDGTGDYLVHFSLAGFRSARTRLTRETGADSILVANATLTSDSAPVALATVQVSAERPKPTRRAGTTLGAGASERYLDGVKGALTPSQAGNLNAIALLGPGYTHDRNGFSILGLGSTQNSTTLNGMALSSSEIPTELTTEVRVSTSAFDPSIGWFSGAQTNVQLSPGWLISARSARLTAAPSALARSDVASLPLGRTDSWMQAGVGGRGAVTSNDTWFYNGAADIDRSSGTTPSVLGASPKYLDALGVPTDSATRLASILQSLGIPAGVANTAGASSIHGNFVVRLDRSPYERGSGDEARQAFSVTAYGTIRQSANYGVTPFTTTGVSQSDVSASGGIQTGYSFFFGDNCLGDVRTSVSVRSSSSQPQFHGPHGVVRIASEQSRNAARVSQIDFGAGAAAGSSQSAVWESVGEFQFYPPRQSVHRLKLTTDVRYDGFRVEDTSNQYGSFVFNSLGDLENGTPLSFSRTLTSTQATAGEWNGFAALGDYWTPSKTFQAVAGARAEFNAFTRRPAANGPVERAFGTRTAFTPALVHVSPRIGFTWIRGDARILGSSSALGRFNYGPRASIRGGFGEFRGMTPPELLVGPMTYDGRNGVTQSNCFGASAPVPNWTSGVPNDPQGQCVGSNPLLVVNAPSIRLIDRAYAPPTSWRANLAYATSLHRFNVSFEALYSLNLHQPSLENLNFTNHAQFLTADESRPVFVPAAHIDAASGVIPSDGARIDSAFASVLRIGARGRSISKQFTATFTPLPVGRSQWMVLGSYSLVSVRNTANGFTTTTFDSPVNRESSSASAVPRHQFKIQSGYYWRRGVQLTLYAAVFSGSRFTPVVAGDVNGDGYANDRAYLFDSAAAGHRDESSALQTFAMASSRRIRSCLTRQSGRPAAPASCSGPWTTASSLQLGFSGRALHITSRAEVSLNVSNPLGGLDQLIHSNGSNAGWGAASAPDPVLYSVRDFDASTNAFQYAVNPGFGSNRGARVAVASPVVATLQVRFDLSRPYDAQQLDRALKPGRAGRPGPKLTFEQLRRGYARSVLNPYTSLILLSDSLLLSRTQIDSLRALQVLLAARMDSVFTSLATYLANLPNAYDVSEALHRQDGALDRAAGLAHADALANWKAVLTPVQLRVLPRFLALYLDPALPASQFRGAAPF